MNTETTQLIVAVIEATNGLAVANRYTPIGSWYQGDHGKAHRELLTALRALVKQLKSTKENNGMLTSILKYMAGVRARGTGPSILKTLQQTVDPSL